MVGLRGRSSRETHPHVSKFWKKWLLFCGHFVQDASWMRKHLHHFQFGDFFLRVSHSRKIPNETPQEKHHHLSRPKEGANDEHLIKQTNTHTHTHTLSLSLSLSHTHKATQANKSKKPGEVKYHYDANQHEHITERIKTTVHRSANEEAKDDG